MDERAEVALLTRNVKIEGEESSSVDGFGGQVMVMNGGTARIEGAELTRMGQKAVLRRYPLHLHMLGDSGGGSYVEDSSIHPPTTAASPCTGRTGSGSPATPASTT